MFSRFKTQRAFYSRKRPTIIPSKIDLVLNTKKHVLPINQRGRLNADNQPNATNTLGSLSASIPYYRYETIVPKHTVDAPNLPRSIQHELEWMARGLLHRPVYITASRRWIQQVLLLWQDHAGSNSALVEVAKGLSSRLKADLVSVGYQPLMEAVRRATLHRLRREKRETKQQEENAAKEKGGTSATEDKAVSSKDAVKPKSMEKLDRMILRKSRGRSALDEDAAEKFLTKFSQALGATAQSLNKEQRKDGGVSIFHISASSTEDEVDDQLEEEEEFEDDQQQQHSLHDQVEEESIDELFQGSSIGQEAALSPTVLLSREDWLLGQTKVQDYGSVLDQLALMIKQKRSDSKTPVVLLFQDYGDFNPHGARLTAAFQTMSESSRFENVLPVVLVTPPISTVDESTKEQESASALRSKNDTFGRSSNERKLSKQSSPTLRDRDWCISLGDYINAVHVPEPIPSSSSEILKTYGQIIKAGLSDRIQQHNRYSLLREARRMDFGLRVETVAALPIFDDHILSPPALKQLLTLAYGHRVSSMHRKPSSPIRGRRKLYLNARDLQHALEIIRQRKQGHEDVAAENNPTASILKRMQAASSDLNTYEKKIMSAVVLPEKTKVMFKDIACLTRTKETLQSIIALPLIRPSFFQYGVLKDSVSGVLLFGPPGTGKTMLAKAIAAECGSAFLNITPSNVYNMYVGEGEKNAKAIFTLARKLAPCVIFIDEVDSIFDTRDASRSYATKREIINEFMAEWDGVTSQNNGVIVVAATNRPFDLDDAVLRRLPRRILIDLPTEKEREDILHILLKSEKLDPSLSIRNLAAKTTHYSGSDLKNVCISAALQAVRESLKEELKGRNFMRTDGTLELTKESEGNPSPIRTLKSEHFLQALKEVPSSISEEQESLERLRKWNITFGDESGFRSKSKVKFGF